MPGQQLHDHDLHRSPTLRRWDNGQPWAVWDHATIRLGQLADGRWWITWTSTTYRPPLAFHHEDEALSAVDWVISHTPGFTWSEVPPDWQPRGDGYGNGPPSVPG